MTTRTRIGIACATAIAIALPLFAAEPLGVKVGLWENTVTTQIGGVTIPAEQLEKMPAAERAQMQQMMQKMASGVSQTGTDKSCITAADLNENPFGQSIKQSGQDCDYKQISGTSKRQEWTFQCKSADGSGSGHLVVEALSDTHVRGTMEAHMAQGNMSAKFEAKWLSASCAGADKD